RVGGGRADLAVSMSARLSVPLPPPLVLISLGSFGYVCEVLLRQDRWACSLLSSGQTAMASRFAAAGRPSARHLVAGAPHHRGPYSDAIVLDGAVAALEAETADRKSTRP